MGECPTAEGPDRNDGRLIGRCRYLDRRIGHRCLYYSVCRDGHTVHLFPLLLMQKPS